jgi:disulfide bond formation protein DsbB
MSSTAFSVVLRRWPWFALIASAAMLGAAHAFETFGRLRPCTLCLKQREAYWIAGAIAAVGAAIDLSPWRDRLGRWVCVLLALAFVYSLGWAGFHAGVEQHWWKGLPECSGGSTNGVSADDIARMLNGGKSHFAGCDTIVWSWLGLSMAGWNTLISAVLVVVSAAAALRKRAP